MDKDNSRLSKRGIPIMNNESVEDILAEPERKDQERRERKFKKILEEKKCWFCDYGICIPPFPFECSMMLPDKTGKKKWIHFHSGGRCPEEMTCEYFEINNANPGVDERDKWLDAIHIIVD